MVKPIILWVDDDEDDRETFRQAAIEAGLNVTIRHARNGVEALAYLQEQKNGGTLPCLVILDMNMPQMDGRSTLAEIRATPEFSNLQVIVFSTSASPLDELFCRKYGSEIYRKPNSFEKLKEVIVSFGNLCRTGRK